MTERIMRRSAITGRLVSEAYAKRHPNTTVVERRRVNQKTSRIKRKA
jgi:hypothetical protein